MVIIGKTLVQQTSTSNHTFKREIWDKFTEWNEFSKFQKVNEVNFSQISWINMWFLINHMWQALKEALKGKNYKKKTKTKKNNQYQQI